MTPTQLTLRHLRNEGWPLVEKVEHWNAHAHISQDLFGFIDVIALRPNETLAVQATTAPNVAARIHKIADSPTVAHVRDAGWQIVVHGWAKKAGRWTLAREVDVS